MDQLVFIKDGKAVTDSLTVAELFKKEHRNVMADIENQIAKLAQADEKEWGVLNFQHTHYQHLQNKQWYPKIDMSEEGFALVVMAYVTPETMKMKVRFIEEFKALRLRLQQAQAIDITKLDPNLQMFHHVFQSVAIAQLETSEAKRIAEAANTRAEHTEAVVSEIKDTFLQRDEDWRTWVNEMLNKAANRLGGGKERFQELRSKSYEMLTIRAKCKLDVRLEGLKRRLFEAGAGKTKIRNAKKLDCIEDDARLQEIYTSIVKELSIGSL